MKKTTTLLFALILGIGVVLADGSEEKKEAEMRVKILPGKSEQIYKLMYLSKEKGMVNVNFYDESGKKFFTDRVYNKKGFLRPYSFESLPEGTYTIELIDPKGSISREVTHVSKAANLDVALKASDEKKYELRVMGETIKPVLVKIYDRSYDLVAEDYIINDKSFTKTYNLSKLPYGHYTFEVISQGEVIAKTAF